MEKVISIGCGFRHDGLIGIDKGDYGQKYVRDLRRGLPFDDNSIDHIIADNVLEHIPKTETFGEDDFVFIMNECLRVLKKGGTIHILAPTGDNDTFHKDPTHHRGFTVKSLKYMLPEDKWEYGFVKGWKENKCDCINGKLIEAELEKL